MQCNKLTRNRIYVLRKCKPFLNRIEIKISFIKNYFLCNMKKLYCKSLKFTSSRLMVSILYPILIIHNVFHAVDGAMSTDETGAGAVFNKDVLNTNTDRSGKDNSFYFTNDNEHSNKRVNDNSGVLSENNFYIRSEAGVERVGIQDALRSYPQLQAPQTGRMEQNQWNTGNYVATTPRIDGENFKKLVSYDDNYEDEPQSSGTSLTSLFGQAKTMWDVYRAFSSAWNAIASENNDGKVPVAKNETGDDRLKRQSIHDDSDEKITTVNPDILSKDVESESETQTTTEIAVDEGRYIKGNPLKGYYDFVITEGSYKFWAAFQLATAVLIIYSTFAAIYYSKVNPLVGDYEYVDYLGGGRSLSGDVDFEDTTDSSLYETTTDPYRNSKPEGSFNTSNSSFSDSLGDAWSSIVQGKWLSKAGHAFEFVLDAIEKIPQSDT